MSGVKVLKPESLENLINALIDIVFLNAVIITENGVSRLGGSPGGEFAAKTAEIAWQLLEDLGHDWDTK